MLKLRYDQCRSLCVIFGVIFLALLPHSVRAADCFEVSIVSPAPFLGNHDEVVKLSDGSFWQVKYEYNYMYEYYPSVQLCPSAGKLVVKGKALNVVQLSRAPAKGAEQRATRSATAITVVLVKSGCDYFVADGPGGYYLLEWFGGHSPSKGDTIVGEISDFGFKDVFYANVSSAGRVWVDDYLLSRDRVAEKFAEKCE
jgi:hypothetical protein